MDHFNRVKAMMKTKIKFRFSFYSAIVCLLLFAVSCSNSYDNREQAENFLDKQTAGAVSPETKIVEEMDRGTGELPTRFQNPSFLLEKSGSYVEADDFSVPVGADISSNRGPVTLRDILKRLAVLKQMNVSWAADVDQKALVDVDIRAEDDYYKAIENILRQLDYFYEIEGNSIVVKYRDTQTFHLAMPFLKQTYTSGVGGDVLGSGDKGHEMKGLIDLVSEGSSGDSFNIWANVETNLDALLQVYAETEVEDSVDLTDVSSPVVAGEPDATPKSTTTRTKKKGALGYYMIDKPIGLITVTAPRTFLSRVESYIESLKKIVYRQISIEAKIVEVTLSGDTRTGLDWSSLLNGKAISGFIDLQHNTTGYRSGMDYEQFLSFGNISFSVLLDAMEEQGHVEVLANPRITVMNGQPALISVGTDTKYVSEITVTPGTTDAPGDKYSSTQDSVVSGLGLGVVATILNGDEVVLHLTPVTSDLLEMGEAQIGNDGGFVGLPVVRLRELSSTIRVKSGNMLVVGGLINSNNAYDENKVVGLGDVPLISKLFGKSGNVVKKTEMVILLRPVIID
jgi:MSHA type pilus biogenesis protein MshL